MIIGSFFIKQSLAFIEKNNNNINVKSSVWRAIMSTTKLTAEPRIEMQTCHQHGTKHPKGTKCKKCTEWGITKKQFSTKKIGQLPSK
jgi:hypothetical protein